MESPAYDQSLARFWFSIDLLAMFEIPFIVGKALLHLGRQCLCIMTMVGISSRWEMEVLRYRIIVRCGETFMVVGWEEGFSRFD